MSEEIKNNEENIEAAEAPKTEEPRTEQAPQAEAAKPEEAAKPAETTRPAEGSAPRQRPEGRRDDRKPYQRQERSPRFRKKVCRFCYDKDLKIDYKNPDILHKFITDRGKILPRRVTGTCAKHQRELAVAIKKARIIALLPFVEK